MRSVPATADTRCPPFFGSRFLVERNDRSSLDACIHNHGVLVEHWRGCRTPIVRFVSDICMPDFFPLEIEAIHASLAKENVELLAVRDWRARAVAMPGIVSVTVV